MGRGTHPILRRDGGELNEERRKDMQLDDEPEYI